MSVTTRDRGKGVPMFVGMLFLLLFSDMPSMKAMAQDTTFTPSVITPANAVVSVVVEEHSARKALLWSLLPGGGQVYNGQAWKVPVIYGAFAGMGYAIHYYYSRMTMFKDEYLYRVNNGGATNLDDYASYPTSNIYNLYNSYNRNFQLMVIITVGIYALNLVDAYVFGHLYDFQISDDLSLSLSPSLLPTPGGFQPSFGLTLSF